MIYYNITILSYKENYERSISMDINLKNDLENIDMLLEKVTISAFDFLKDINEIATFPNSI
ncbi:hypothetical protein [Clostridium sporogenes]|nr:hypothetical protein [Clostridium sporogenes]